MSILIYPQNNTIIDTHTSIQNGFIEKISKNGITDALEWLFPIKKGNELTHPESIRFEWLMEKDESSYIFEISENACFSPSFSAETQNNFFVMTNFKIGQKYYWRINGCSPFTFTTKDNRFRFIEAEGALNIRDLGGINIKQGLLFRGSEINKEYKITPSGKSVLKNDLRIKTEVSLRKEFELPDGISCIDDGILYKFLPYRPYNEVFEEEHRKELVHIMEFLANEDNYPIYFHCLGGADRTGMIALYLRALLGESEEDILTDYELTSLSSYAYGLSEGVSALGFRSRLSDYFQEFFNRFNTYEGEDLCKKTESFLIDCRVKTETIDKIKKILKK